MPEENEPIDSPNQGPPSTGTPASEPAPEGKASPAQGTDVEGLTAAAAVATEPNGQLKPVAHETRPMNYVKFVVLLMGLISLMDNYLAQVELGVFTYMAADLGYTAATQNQLLLLISAYGVLAFAVFFISWATDALGRKKGLIILVLAMGLPAAFLPLTPSGPAGLHASILLYSLITMATLANVWEIPVAEEAPPEKRGLYGALAFLMGMIPVYAILGPSIAESLGWKWAYALWGIIFMVICLTLLLTKFKETERWERTKADRGHAFLKIKHALKTLSRRDWLYVLLMAGVYFMWSAVFKMGTLRFQDYYNSLGLLEEYNDVYLIVGGLLTVVGALLAGVFMDKIGRRNTLIVGCGGSILSLVMLAFTGSPVALWGVFLFMPLVLAWITVYFTEIFPTKIRGTCMGIVVTISRAAYVVGPALASLYLPLGWQTYWILAGLLMLIPLAALAVKPYEAMGKTIEEIEVHRDA